MRAEKNMFEIQSPFAPRTIRQEKELLEASKKISKIIRHLADNLPKDWAPPIPISSRNEI